MDSLGTLPGKISGIPLTRPDVVRVKLTHPAPLVLPKPTWVEATREDL
jgi:hypothetical protein